MLLVDPTGRVTLWHPGAVRLLGWDAEQMQGASFADLLPAAHRPRLMHAIGSSEPHGVAFRTLLQHRTAGWLPMELEICALPGPDPSRGGALIGMRAAESGSDAAPRALGTATARFSHSPMAQASLDSTGTIVAANPALATLSGYSQEQLVGRSALEFLTDTHREVGTTSWAATVSGQLPTKQVLRSLHRADGAYRDVRLSMFSVLTETGELETVEVVVEDVTETLQAREALRASEVRRQELALRSADVSFLATAQGDVQFVSPSLTRYFGYEPAALVGQNIFAFFHPDDEAAARAGWAQALALNGTPVTFRARVRAADGSWRWIEETATNWLADSDIRAVVANVIDITDAIRSEQQAPALADTDAPTGLLGRSALLRRLGQHLADGGADATLLVLSLDGFRAINATFGCDVADDVMVAVADRLRECVGVDHAARLGSDLFAVLSTDGSTPHEGSERIAAEFARPLQVGNRSIPLRVTTGAVLVAPVHPGVPADAHAVLRAAENALARAHAGSPQEEQGARDAGTTVDVAELRAALDQGQIVAHYQPIVDLGTGRTVGVEALARWAHPRRGLLLPAEFLDLAESSGLITELGAAVLDGACAAAHRWGADGSRSAPLSVSVNLSPRQVSQPDIVAVVRDCLARHALPPERLILEVTETAVLDDLDAATATLRELRALGVGLALDDFGTGYSSLTYLKQFPFTRLKIDRSFVAGICTDGDDNAIVTSVLQLARSVGLECTAEGVESTDQESLLAHLGCGTAQGWLYGRAMTDEDLVRWLAAQRPRPRPLRSGPAAAVSPAQPRQSLPVPAQLGARILALQNEGASLNTIAAALNAEGLTTAEGRRWSRRSIARTIAQLNSALHGALPPLVPTMGFDEACAVVVEFLSATIPLGMWAVTRYDGSDQVLLDVRDSAYGLQPGVALPWDGSVCRRMIAGYGPQIAPALSSIPAFAGAPVAQQLDIGCYVGIPIRWADGRLFGTLCGLDPSPQSEILTAHEAMLTVLADLLATVLAADHARVRASRERLRSDLLAAPDATTGLLDRVAWTQLLQGEQHWAERFGDPGSVLVVGVDRPDAAADDNYLRTTSQILRWNVRIGDQVARLDDGTFGVLVLNATVDCGDQLVTRVQSALARADILASIGQASSRQEGSLHAAWERAEQAMRHARADPGRAPVGGSSQLRPCGCRKGHPPEGRTRRQCLLEKRFGQ